MAPTSTGSPASGPARRWLPGYLPPWRVAGIPVRLHTLVVPFHLAVAWIAVDGGAGAVGTRLLVIGVLLLTVLAHELGHAVVARRRGLVVREVRLHALGGVALIERPPPARWRAGDEAVPALGGPVVNLLLGAMAYLVLEATGHNVMASVVSRRWVDDPPVAFAVGNLALGTINLLPAFPADGGRVLRAVLVRPLGHVRATLVALCVGAGLASAGAVWAMATFGPPAVVVVVALFALLVFHGAEEWRVALSRAAATIPTSATPWAPPTPPATVGHDVEV